MRRKLLLSYAVLVLVIVVPLSVVINNALKDQLVTQYEAQLENEIGLVKEHLLDIDLNETSFKEFAYGVKEMLDVRVTIINGSGVVQADSEEDPAKMDNHINREEVRTALATNTLASSVRYSSTLKTEYLYTAIPVTLQETHYIIRISKPLFELNEINDTIKRYTMLSTVIAIVLAMIIAWLMSRRITGPIDELTEAAKDISAGNYGKKIYTHTSDQIGELTNSFNHMSVNLAVTMSNLKQRNVELEAILNSMINGIIAIDADKNILMINPICFEILNLPSDYIVENESMYKIIRNDELAEMVEDAIESGISQVKELSYVHLDKILRIYINPIITTEKDIIGSIVVLQDVTQIRKLEQMRSDFVSNVSHELKTPLTSIKGFVDTLKNGAISDEGTALRFLDIIDIESDRLYRLINDILILSEIERMDKDYDKERVEVCEVIDEVVDMLSLKAEQKNIGLSAEMDGPMTMLGNRDRVKQMMINLVDNALKYTEVGEVNIKITSTGNWIKITVSDTGIGIPEEHLNRLFERFYRVDKGRSRNQGGTGLGLSIVKHIVLLYKGKISVTSTVNGGTTFEILFPKDIEQS
ncbi:MAG: two-component system, OmpR family, phosphate regulon sensor histidine kinase PhoR [Clostridiales bacterium]|jgi:two-component system phosphate regulon sensor histidine kinase PhoR|nr:two-component system, OmpR family, phosphate regulon sensor histidine kinase PhoR [Clostridiales bacterium]MDN5299190.1 two-component system, OmpR family, phosphate regulon sensor histidine kinase PhoR [Clostridiales bacterium]